MGIEGTLSAKDRGDLLRLADALNELPPSAHPGIAARVLAEGMMLPKGIAARLMSWAVKVIQWRRKIDAYDAYSLVLVDPRCWQIATDTFDQTVKWLVYGRDTSMKGSMGGFNQDELDKLCRMYDLCTGYLATPRR